MNPALPAPAFTIVQQQTGQELSGEIKSPDYLAGRALATALLPKDDPALRHATPASIAGLTLDDTKSYYRSVFRPDLTTIVIAGDVTPEHGKALVEKIFRRVDRHRRKTRHVQAAGRFHRTVPRRSPLRRRDARRAA